MNADQILARKTASQLEAAIAKGRSMLEVAAAIMPLGYGNGDDFDGPFPPSRQLEVWCASYQDERERLIKIGISDAVNELARRAIAPATQS